ncbi:hypothetical protein GCM10023189_17790 [Nibrella saemangeumensis]|uniref:BNR repeat-containing family member n=1 Tax=Nibrella saemangeumensis TaxID=1084526 RepID=A0ABP8MN26_9BACT
MVEQLDIAKVWPGHPVGFSLLTHPPHQYVAYYDQDRHLTVAYRRLGQNRWTYQVLPTRVGWDSHNYIAMALDRNGHLHLSGNMHSDTLKYFYATRPHDITSIRRMPGMTGREELRTTYPEFFNGPAGEMIFAYRDGSSGSGNQIYNRYDPAQNVWKRLLDTPLVDGEGLMNAYLKGPLVGPDGYYHLVWVWRDTPDAATNHDLSYARSKDLIHWEKSNGTPLRLPITLATAEIIDPVPAKGGMINGNTVIGFDAQQRPVITYHKYDGQGNTQIYNARREATGWKLYQATDWQHRWEFGGGGSIEAEVGVQPVQVSRSGQLTMAYKSKRAGDGLLVLDPTTLKPVQTLPFPVKTPPALLNAETLFPGIQVNIREDDNTVPEPDSRYILRWETLGRNRDRPRQGPIPEPGMLRLYRLR